MNQVQNQEDFAIDRSNAVDLLARLRAHIVEGSKNASSSFGWSDLSPQREASVSSNIRALNRCFSIILFGYPTFNEWADYDFEDVDSSHSFCRKEVLVAALELRRRGVEGHATALEELAEALDNRCHWIHCTRHPAGQENLASWRDNDVDVEKPQLFTSWAKVLHLLLLLKDTASTDYSPNKLGPAAIQAVTHSRTRKGQATFSQIVGDMCPRSFFSLEEACAGTSTKTLFRKNSDSRMEQVDSGCHESSQEVSPSSSDSTEDMDFSRVSFYGNDDVSPQTSSMGANYDTYYPPWVFSNLSKESHLLTETQRIELDAIPGDPLFNHFLFRQPEVHAGLQEQDNFSIKESTILKQEKVDGGAPLLGAQRHFAMDPRSDGFKQLGFRLSLPPLDETAIDPLKSAMLTREFRRAEHDPSVRRVQVNNAAYVGKEPSIALSSAYVTPVKKDSRFAEKGQEDYRVPDGWLFSEASANTFSAVFAAFYTDHLSGRQGLISDKKLLKDAQSALRGVPSSTFHVDHNYRKLCWNDREGRPRLKGTTFSSLKNAMNQVARTGTLYKRLEILMTYLGRGEAGQICQAFAEEGKKQLEAVSTFQDICSLVELSCIVEMILDSLCFLARICNCDNNKDWELLSDSPQWNQDVTLGFACSEQAVKNFPKGANLLANLMKITRNTAFMLTEAQRSLITRLQGASLVPYLRFCLRWMCSGTVTEEDDAYGEFAIRVSPQLALSTKVTSEIVRSGGECFFSEAFTGPSQPLGSPSEDSRNHTLEGSVRPCSKECVGIAPDLLPPRTSVLLSRTGKLLNLIRLTSPDVYKFCSLDNQEFGSVFSDGVLQPYSVRVLMGVVEEQAILVLAYFEGLQTLRTAVKDRQITLRRQGLIKQRAIYSQRAESERSHRVKALTQKRRLYKELMQVETDVARGNGRNRIENIPRRDTSQLEAAARSLLLRKYGSLIEDADTRLRAATWKRLRLQRLPAARKALASLYTKEAATLQLEKNAKEQASDGSRGEARAMALESSSEDTSFSNIRVTEPPGGSGAAAAALIEGNGGMLGSFSGIRIAQSTRVGVSGLPDGGDDTFRSFSGIKISNVTRSGISDAGKLIKQEEDGPSSFSSIRILQAPGGEATYLNSEVISTSIENPSKSFSGVRVSQATRNGTSEARQLITGGGLLETLRGVFPLTTAKGNNNEVFRTTPEADTASASRQTESLSGVRISHSTRSGVSEAALIMDGKSSRPSTYSGIRLLQAPGGRITGVTAPTDTDGPAESFSGIKVTQAAGGSGENAKELLYGDGGKVAPFSSIRVLKAPGGDLNPVREVSFQPAPWQTLRIGTSLQNSPSLQDSTASHDKDHTLGSERDSDGDLKTPRDEAALYTRGQSCRGSIPHDNVLQLGEDDANNSGLLPPKIELLTSNSLKPEPEQKSSSPRTKHSNLESQSFHEVQPEQSADPPYSQYDELFGKTVAQELRSYHEQYGDSSAVISFTPFQLSSQCLHVMEDSGRKSPHDSSSDLDLEQTLGAFIRRRAEVVEQAALKLFLIELECAQYFRSIRNFMLLEGSYMDSFMRALLQALYSRDPRERSFFYDLTRAVHSQVPLDGADEDKFCSNFSYQVDQKRLQDALGKGALEPQVLEILNLLRPQYEVKWPFGVIVSQKMLRQYQTIHELLLKIHASSILLSDLHLSAKALFSRGIRGTITPSPQETGSLSASRWLESYRHELLYFIREIESYFAIEVLMSASKTFENDLAQVGSVNGLQEIHGSYVANIYDRCFLGEDDSEVQEALEAIIRKALRFRSVTVAYASRTETLPESTFALLVRDRQTFAAKRASLIRTVRKKLESRPGTSRAHLESLLCRLDFNDYYRGS